MSTAESDSKARAAVIGKKIKALRRESGMSQSALSGEFITRNMLSMIESGAAMPSIDTVYSLAEALGVPCGYFFASEDEEKMYRKMKVSDEIYRMISAEDFENAAKLCENISENDPEISMCLVFCRMRLGANAMSEYRLATADRFFSLAADAAAKLHIGKSSILSICGFVRNLIHGAVPASLSGPYIAGDLNFNDTYALVPPHFAAYLMSLKMLDAGENDAASFAVNSGLCGDFYSMHLRGAVLRRAAETDAAANILESALRSGGGGFYSRYRIICDLEICRRETGDFESAYKMSSQRMDMLGMFSK